MHRKVVLSAPTPGRKSRAEGRCMVTSFPSQEHDSSRKKLLRAEEKPLLPVGEGGGICQEHQESNRQWWADVGKMRSNPNRAAGTLKTLKCTNFPLHYASSHLTEVLKMDALITRPLYPFPSSDRDAVFFCSKAVNCRFSLASAYHPSDVWGWPFRLPPFAERFLRAVRNVVQLTPENSPLLPRTHSDVKTCWAPCSTQETRTQSLAVGFAPFP